MNMTQLRELLLQSLEHERGGIKIYETAIRCAVRADLKDEWTQYLSQTRQHVEVLTKVCRTLDIDPGMQTPGCMIVKDLGAALVRAMETALAGGQPDASQIVACECVTLAETKDHSNWELIGEAAAAAEGDAQDALGDAYDAIEDQEDEHLYHSKGWCRELWLESLGLDAVLPPPEEVENAMTAVEADEARKAAHPSA